MPITDLRKALAISLALVVMIVVEIAVVIEKALVTMVHAKCSRLPVPLVVRPAKSRLNQVEQNQFSVVSVSVRTNQMTVVDEIDVTIVHNEAHNEASTALLAENAENHVAQALITKPSRNKSLNLRIK